MTQLLLSGPDEIRRYAVSQDDGRVFLTSRSGVPDVHALARAPGGAYCATHREVLRFDDNLNPVTRRGFGSVGALTALPSGEALVSVDGALLVLDPDLEEIGRVQLTGDGKNAHDLLVRGAYVYVLDNIVHPALVWILNLSEPTNPAVLHSAEVVDVSAHLAGQLVPPGAGVWLLFQSGAGFPSRWQHLHVFSAFTGAAQRERAPLAWQMLPGRFAEQFNYAPKPPPDGSEVALASLTGSESKDARPGLSIEYIDPTGSGWAVFQAEHGHQYSGELVVERGHLVARHLASAAGSVCIASGVSHIFILKLDEQHQEMVLRVVSKADGFICDHASVGAAASTRPEPARWRPSMRLVNASAAT